MASNKHLLKEMQELKKTLSSAAPNPNLASSNFEVISSIEEYMEFTVRVKEDSRYKESVVSVFYYAF